MLVNDARTANVKNRLLMQQNMRQAFSWAVAKRIGSVFLGLAHWKGHEISFSVEWE